MKRLIHLFSVLIPCFCLLLLYFCSSEYKEAKLVGTWQGDGSLDIGAIDAPFEYATQLVFREDGTLTVTVAGEELDFRYYATDDTLSINEEEVGYGVSYTLKWSTLSIETGMDRHSEFTKVK